MRVVANFFFATADTTMPAWTKSSPLSTRPHNNSILEYELHETEKEAVRKEHGASDFGYSCVMTPGRGLGPSKKTKK